MAKRKDEAKAKGTEVDALVKARHLLEDFAMAAVQTAKEADALNVKRNGAYALAIKAAGVSGNSETFEKAADAVMDDIRMNRNGFAVKIGAAVAKRQKEGDTVTYVVPKAFSVAKSTVLRAFKYGVSFVDKVGAQVSFGAIRKETDALAAKEAYEASSGIERKKADVLRFLSRIEAIVTDREVTEARVSNVLNQLSRMFADKPAKGADKGANTGEAIAKAA